MVFSLYKAFINLIYPFKCQVCDTALHHNAANSICLNCKQEIEINLPPFCDKCGRPLQTNKYSCKHKHQNLSHIDRAWIACNYQGTIRTLIHNIKYSNKLSLINFAASICCNFAEKFIDLNEIDYITYVPLDRQKKKQRDFNQSELIARKIAKHFNIKLLNKTLLKVRPTRPQIEVSGRERLSNLTGAFKIKRNNLIKDKCVLIIDDVLTTGSTLNECAGCLKQAGACSVLTLALAGGS